MGVVKLHMKPCFEIVNKSQLKDHMSLMLNDDDRENMIELNWRG